MARYHDPFKPLPGETFSRRQVDRAGDVLREFFLWEPGTALDLRSSDVSWAFAAVGWWRSLHAKPLSKVATNLRYHVRREGALVEGSVNVTQRLKRTGTIGDKLTREPTMDVTQMQDVGGVRIACVEHGREIPGALAAELQAAHASVKDTLPGSDG